MINLVLVVHILTGFTALGAAGAALWTVKGAQWHRWAGKIYVGAMLVVVLTTFLLVAVRPNAFLFAVAIFSFFLVFTGWRAAQIRDGQPRLADHLAGGAMALTGMGMMGLGIAGLIGSGSAQPVIMLVFGSLGVTMALSDWRDWRIGPVIGKARIARHLSRMLAGTIATITAAVAVNFSFLPTLVTWLGPTALITPLIFWWNARVMRGATRA